MGEQQQFDFKRATKLRALERIVCSSNVKALLKALDGFARDDRHCTVTMKRLALSMGVSPKTAQRTIRTAQAEGLVSVTGDEWDGRALTYTIEWKLVFDLPDGVSGGRRNGGDETPVKSKATPVKPSFDLTTVPGQRCPRSPVNVDHGPRSRVTGVCATDTNDKDNAAVRQQQIGGVGGLIWKSPERFATRKAGWWAGHIGDLANPEERQRLLTAAITAGYLTGSNVDRVRVWALAMQAKSRPPGMATGHFVIHVEDGDWSWLDPKYVKSAMDRLLSAEGLRLTKAEFEGLRIDEPRMVQHAT